MANHGDMLSTCVCHFGGFPFGFLGRPILQAAAGSRAATRPAPMAIFAASAPSEGAVFGSGGLLPVASTVTVTTMARDTSHPNVHAAPFRTPRCEGSTIMKADSGSGSGVIARPIRGRFSTTAVPPVLLRRKAS